MIPHKTSDRALRILLVDDDPDCRFLSRRLLERLGHRVTVAEGGVEAIGLLRDHVWDVVLTDQNMPGASGIDVLERAFKLQPDALRLLMSSLLDPRTTEEAQTRGHAQAIIEKPLHHGAFEYAGRALLMGREPADSETRRAES
jgi:CheY-like chemotaxis protein